MSKARAYPPKLCAICGELYHPLGGNTRYCVNCRSIAEKRRKEKQGYLGMDKARKRQKEGKEAQRTWSEVIRVCEQHHCTYGQAVARGLI